MCPLLLIFHGGYFMFLILSERVPLWFCDGAHFSVSDRGPKNIDIESLDPTGKQMVENAIACGILIQSESSSTPEPSKTIDQPTKIISQDARVNGLNVQAANNLKGSAKTILSLLKKRKPGYQLLSIMLEIEKSKLKRKTVIKTIEKMLQATGGISAIVDDSSDTEQVLINVV